MDNKNANDRDRLRAADMVLGRVAPVLYQFEHKVEHKVDVQELEFRAAVSGGDEHSAGAAPGFQFIA
jgi:hypothetical protein